MINQAELFLAVSKDLMALAAKAGLELRPRYFGDIPQLETSLWIIKKNGQVVLQADGHNIDNVIDLIEQQLRAN